MPSYSLRLIWLISPQVCIMKCQERIEQSEEERIDSYMPTYPPGVRTGDIFAMSAIHEGCSFAG